MSPKKRLKLPDIDLSYIFSFVQDLKRKSHYDAKAVLLLCKTLYPNEIKVKVMEYVLCKETGNFTEAAKIFSEIFSSGDPFINLETRFIIENLMSSDDFNIQKLFVALPHRVQFDILNMYCVDILPTAAQRTEFLLKFIKEKVELLEANHLNAAICSVLIDSLAEAEAEHWKSSIEVATVCSTFRKRSSPSLSVSVLKKTPKSPSFNFEEGEEEGEVLEEVDEEELCDEDEDDDIIEDDKPSDSTHEPQLPIYVLNVFRMKLTCDVMPIIHRTRNSGKLNNMQLQNLVLNSLQFLLTFAAQTPFVCDLPKISGIADYELPEILQQEPKHYLRLYLDMAADLLGWRTSETTHSTISFQVLSHRALIDQLDEYFRDFELVKDEIETGSQQKNRKRGPKALTSKTTPHTAACRVVCLYWCLFVEAGVGYLKSLPDITSLPLCLQKFLLNWHGAKPIKHVVANSSLTELSDLMLMKVQYFQDLINRNKHQQVEILHLLDCSIKPQDLTLFTIEKSIPATVFKAIRDSCPLERLLRLHVSLGCLDTVKDNLLPCESFLKLAVDFSDDSQISSLVIPFRKEELVRILFLLKTIKLQSNDNKRSQLIQKRICWFREFLKLCSAETYIPIHKNYKDCSAQLTVSDCLQTFEICEAVLQQWLFASLLNSPSGERSVNCAMILSILHQSDIWQITQLEGNVEMITTVFRIIKENWASLRASNVVAWLNLGVIVNSSLLSQIIRIESEALETAVNTESSEFMTKCMSYIRNPPSSPLPIILAEFVKVTAEEIEFCLSL